MVVRSSCCPFYLIAIRYVTIASEVDSCHILIGHLGGIAIHGLCKDGIRIEVGHTHLTATEVGWCTIDTVIGIGGEQTFIRLIDNRRQMLMRASVNIAITQRLSKEQIVVGPYRSPRNDRVTILVDIFTLPSSYVVALRNLTGGITEVTIIEPLFHIAHLWCLRNPLFQWYALRRIVSIRTWIVSRTRHIFRTFRIGRQRTINMSGEVFIRLSGAEVDAIVIAFTQVEAIQVVSHFTVIESLIRHLAGLTAGIESRITLRIVAVHHLNTVRIRRITRIAEYCIHLLRISREGCRRRLYPTVLYEAITLVSHTGRSERTSNSEVIHITAKFSEERIRQSRYLVSVTMHITTETGLACDRSYGLTGRRTIRHRTINICTQDELQILSPTDMATQRSMSLEGARLDESILIQLIFRWCEQTQVEEILQLIQPIFILAWVIIVHRRVVIDINLCWAVHISTVYIEVIILIAFHHLTQVVIVGHLHWHTIRIGLTQISL